MIDVMIFVDRSFVDQSFVDQSKEWSSVRHPGPLPTRAYAPQGHFVDAVRQIRDEIDRRVQALLADLFGKEKVKENGYD